MDFDFQYPFMASATKALAGHIAKIDELIGNGGYVATGDRGRRRNHDQ